VSQEPFWSADPANRRTYVDFYKRLRAVVREVRDLAYEARTRPVTGHQAQLAAQELADNLDSAVDRLMWARRWDDLTNPVRPQSSSESS
jgi:hypothetical protein